jgi:V/A-type H+-transporting ATPase subunit K
VSDLVLVGLAVALTVAVPGILAAMGVAMTGVAAAGLVAEDPKKFSKVFVLEVIPGTQGFYGFISGMLIMIATKMLTKQPSITEGMGLTVLVAAIPAILQGFTAYYQALITTVGVSSVAKKEETFGSCVLFAIMVETYAILGFLSTFLLLIGLGIWG